MTVTSVAARIDLGYDDVEDLRIAVGELFGLLVDESPDTRIELACSPDDDGITVTARRSPVGGSLDIGDLSRQILEAVVDEVTFDVDGGRVVVRKRRRG